MYLPSLIEYNISAMIAMFNDSTIMIIDAVFPFPTLSIVLQFTLLFASTIANNSTDCITSSQLHFEAAILLAWVIVESYRLAVGSGTAREGGGGSVASPPGVPV